MVTSLAGFSLSLASLSHGLMPITNMPGGSRDISMPLALSFTRHGNFVAVMPLRKSASVTTLGSGFCSRTSAQESDFASQPNPTTTITTPTNISTSSPPRHLTSKAIFLLIEQILPTTVLLINIWRPICFMNWCHWI